MKKKFIDFMGFTDQDILEIKTGLSIILKNVFFILKIVIPVISSIMIADYFGVMGYLILIFLVFVALFIGVFIIVSLSQSLGHDYLSEKEIVYFENADGTKGSFLKYKNEVK
jgi:hypothetical protein